MDDDRAEGLTLLIALVLTTAVALPLLAGAARLSMWILGAGCP